MLRLYLLMRIKFLLHFVSVITAFPQSWKNHVIFGILKSPGKVMEFCLKLGRVIEKSGNFEIGAKSHGSSGMYDN